MRGRAIPTRGAAGRKPPLKCGGTPHAKAEPRPARAAFLKKASACQTLSAKPQSAGRQSPAGATRATYETLPAMGAAGRTDAAPELCHPRGRRRGFLKTFPQAYRRLPKCQKAGRPAEKSGAAAFPTALRPPAPSGSLHGHAGQNPRKRKRHKPRKGYQYAVQGS